VIPEEADAPTTAASTNPLAEESITNDPLGAAVDEPDDVSVCGVTCRLGSLI
jgi:hypothetical protein